MGVSLSQAVSISRDSIHLSSGALLPNAVIFNTAHVVVTPTIALFLLLLSNCGFLLRVII